MRALRYLVLALILGIVFIKAEAQENILDQMEDIAIIDQKVMMPMCDGIKLATDIYRPIGVCERMITRMPDDTEWYEGGLYHDNMDFGVPSLWICSWYDLSISPNLELFKHVLHNASDPEVRKTST